MKPARTTCIPTPEDIGLPVPAHLIADRFCSGFHHALSGGQINKVEQLRLSFREGFRAGKLYLKELRRRKGIIAFPVMGKIRMRVRS
jgi:hypothetical protein